MSRILAASPDQLRELLRPSGGTRAKFPVHPTAEAEAERVTGSVSKTVGNIIDVVKNVKPIFGAIGGAIAGKIQSDIHEKAKARDREQLAALNTDSAANAIDRDVEMANSEAAAAIDPLSMMSESDPGMMETAISGAGETIRKLVESQASGQPAPQDLQQTTTDQSMATAISQANIARQLARAQSMSRGAFSAIPEEAAASDVAEQKEYLVGGLWPDVGYRYQDTAGARAQGMLEGAGGGMAAAGSGAAPAPGPRQYTASGDPPATTDYRLDAVRGPNDKLPIYSNPQPGAQYADAIRALARAQAQAAATGAVPTSSSSPAGPVGREMPPQVRLGEPLQPTAQGGAAAQPEAASVAPAAPVPTPAPAAPADHVGTGSEWTPDRATPSVPATSTPNTTGAGAEGGGEGSGGSGSVSTSTGSSEKVSTRIRGQLFDSKKSEAARASAETELLKSMGLTGNEKMPSHDDLEAADKAAEDAHTRELLAQFNPESETWTLADVISAARGATTTAQQRIVTLALSSAIDVSNLGGPSGSNIDALIQPGREADAYTKILGKLPFPKAKEAMSELERLDLESKVRFRLSRTDKILAMLPMDVRDKWLDILTKIDKLGRAGLIDMAKVEMMKARALLYAAQRKSPERFRNSLNIYTGSMRRAAEKDQDEARKERVDITKWLRGQAEDDAKDVAKLNALTKNLEALNAGKRGDGPSREDLAAESAGLKGSITRKRAELAAAQAKLKGTKDALDELRKGSASGSISVTRKELDEAKELEAKAQERVRELVAEVGSLETARKLALEGAPHAWSKKAGEKAEEIREQITLLREQIGGRAPLIALSAIYRLQRTLDINAQHLFLLELDDFRNQAQAMSPKEKFDNFRSLMVNGRMVDRGRVPGWEIGRVPVHLRKKYELEGAVYGKSPKDALKGSLSNEMENR